MKYSSLYSNSVWLIADKILRLGLGLIVWMLLARHLGPAVFGQWSFAIAFAALFAVVAGLGFDGVLQRELLSENADMPGLLGTAVVLRFSAGCLSAVVCVSLAWFYRSAQPEVVALVGLNSLVFLLQFYQVVEYLFQARMQNFYTVVALNIAFIFTTLIRIIFLWYEVSLLWFGATLVIEACLAGILMYWASQRVNLELYRWRFDRTIALRLLSQSWPLLFSGMAVILYMRLDQIMLASMVGDEAVGQFSAAVRLSEVWYFVPGAILAAAFPVLLAKRKQGKQAYEYYLQVLYDVMAWGGLFVAVIVSFTAPWIVERIYGQEYSDVASIWQLQTWAGISVAMSYVHGKWLLAEGLQRIGLFYTLTGCIVNFNINLLLIPQFGAEGAALATLATQIGLLPMQLIFPKTRGNFLMMLKTIGAPLRYWRL